MAKIPRTRTPLAYSPDLDDALPEQGNVWGWMILPLRRYARFEGRSCRREFWWYSLFLFLGYTLVPMVVFGALSLMSQADAVGIAAVGYYLLFFFGNLVPGLALSVRRLHDLGLPGALMIAAYAAFLFLSILGWLGYLVVMALPGQDRENRYGVPVGDRATKATADIFS